MRSSPRPVWTAWEDLVREWTSRDRLLLVLDFDGTLSPLEEFPHQARLPETTRALVRRLVDRRGVGVAVISGRAVADIRALVGLRKIYYSGNHGLEIEGPGLSFRHPEAESLEGAMRKLARALRADFRRLKGVVIENKGMTLSLHYRHLAAERSDELKPLMLAWRRRTAGRPVRWRGGHKVWELVPDAGWDKGRAALHILHHLRNPYPVALGDDRTDEDMFLALRDRGTTIRIGRPGPTVAQFRLASQKETDRFLGCLDAALAGRA